MNKGRRNELRKLKYKRRLKLMGCLSPETLNRPKGVRMGVSYNFTGFIESGKPCSCEFCTPTNKKKDMPPPINKKAVIQEWDSRYDEDERQEDIIHQTMYEK